MADLITASYAKQALQADASFSEPEDLVIAALVTAVSQAGRRFCGRNFDSRTTGGPRRPR